MQSLTWEEKKLCLSAINIVTAVRQNNKTVILRKDQLAKNASGIARNSFQVCPLCILYICMLTSNSDS